MKPSASTPENEDKAQCLLADFFAKVYEQMLLWVAELPDKAKMVKQGTLFSVIELTRRATMCDLV
jgi:hypothetical protein